jgi:hypothetical protein
VALYYSKEVVAVLTVMLPYPKGLLSVETVANKYNLVTPVVAVALPCLLM